MHDDLESDISSSTEENASQQSSLGITNSKSSNDDLFESSTLENETRILALLPNGYIYKLLQVVEYTDINSFHCTFKLKLDTEENTRNWIAAYNDKTKETMVFNCCKSGKGKRVEKKFYLRCHHKQRQTGKHTKSSKILKTTHRAHNNKHTDCPAKLIVTLYSPRKNYHGFVLMLC